MEKHTKRLIQQSEKERQLRRLNNFQKVLTLIRILGCLIVILDLTCKIQYFISSQFYSNLLKKVYLAFLFIRPLAILSIVAFHVIIRKSRIQIFQKYVVNFETRNAALETDQKENQQSIITHESRDPLKESKTEQIGEMNDSLKEGGDNDLKNRPNSAPQSAHQKSDSSSYYDEEQEADQS